MKAKCKVIDAAFVKGFEASTDEECLDTSGGVPPYDMCMKGLFIANMNRGRIDRVLADYGIEAPFITGSLLEEE